MIWPISMVVIVSLVNIFFLEIISFVKLFYRLKKSVGVYLGYGVESKKSLMEAPFYF
jgi:hypothetical protein